MPHGQRTRDVGGEADRVAWLRPADALAAHERGEMSMLPPTMATLTDIAAHETVNDVLTAGVRRDVTPVMPKVLLDADDKIRFLLPHDPDYPREPVG